MSRYRAFLETIGDRSDLTIYSLVLGEMENLLDYLGSCGHICVQPMPHMGSALLKEYCVTCAPDHRCEKDAVLKSVVEIYDRSIQDMKTTHISEKGSLLHISNAAKKTYDRSEEVNVVVKSTLPLIGGIKEKENGLVEFTLSQLENTRLKEYETLSFMLKEYL
ncbi:MAG: hypothetical protein V1870_03580 [Candidatus Aenigmatarchaeota archaeon]